MKKIIFLITCFSIIVFHYCFSEQSTSIYPTWSDEIVKCYKMIEENKPWTNNIKNPLNSKKYLICEKDGNINHLYQAVLDVLFTDIDNKVESYLETLPKEKIDLKACNDVSDKFSYNKWDFYKKYKEVCETGVKDYIAELMKNKKEIWIEVNISGGIENFLINNSSKCIPLVETKLKSYEDTAWLILNRNIVDSYKKDKQKFMNDLKGKYRKLLLSLTEYMAQVLKINNQWNKATKKAQK